MMYSDTITTISHMKKIQILYVDEEHLIPKEEIKKIFSVNYVNKNISLNNNLFYF